MKENQDLLTEISMRVQDDRIRNRNADAKGFFTGWCPFHGDGKGEGKQHKPNLRYSEKGFHCFACGEKGNLKRLAEKLGIPVEDYHKPKDDIVAVYDYQDKNGKLLHQVVRYIPKDFRQRRPDGKGGYIWNLNGTEPVPYRLPELLAADKEQAVYIAEGEKDADRLRIEGLTATTNSGGAGKWKPEFAKYLEGRDIIIIPDNDEPGRKHADNVAKSLHGKVKSLKVVTLPDMQDGKKDVSDYLNSGHTIDELKMLIDDANEWTGASGESTAAAESSSKTADKLLSLVLESGIELFHDQRGEAYARIKISDRREIIKLRTESFKTYLSRMAWQKIGKPVYDERLTGVIRTLQAKAMFDGQEYKLETRYHQSDNDIWIDLDGHKAVKVSANTWDIVDEPPILFRHFEHQEALPEPIKGGDAHKVFDLLNLKDEDAKILYLSFLVVSMIPEIPVALLIAHGVQGSAKTTLLKITKKLIDASSVLVRGGISDLRDFAIAASQNRMLFMDNLTTLPDNLSDCLCRAISCEGFTTRALYTDEDSKVFKYQIVLGLGGINPVAHRPDLLDRSLLIEMEPIPADKRMTEKELWQKFDDIKGSVFGGLLDALSKAMAIEPTLVIPTKPRMADFARWGAAAAVALGYTARQFLDAYNRNVGKQNETAIDESIVAQAVQDFMTDKNKWTGTSQELLNVISELPQLNTNAKNLPKNAVWLSRQLKAVQQNLIAIGIKVIHKKINGKKTMTLEKIAENTDLPDLPTLNDHFERYEAEVSVNSNMVSVNSE